MFNDISFYHCGQYQMPRMPIQTPYGGTPLSFAATSGTHATHPSTSLITSSPTGSMPTLSMSCVQHARGTLLRVHFDSRMGKVALRVGERTKKLRCRNAMVKSILLCAMPLMHSPLWSHNACVSWLKNLCSSLPWLKPFRCFFVAQTMSFSQLVA